MNTLQSFNINCDDTKESLAATLKSKLDEKTLLSVRQQLFDAAKQLKLTHCDNKLVTRLRRARGPTIQEKLANDVANLTYTLRNRLPVPRVLLRNGKRDINTFLESRENECLSVVTPCIGKDNLGNAFDKTTSASSDAQTAMSGTTPMTLADYSHGIPSVDPVSKAAIPTPILSTHMEASQFAPTSVIGCSHDARALPGEVVGCDIADLVEEVKRLSLSMKSLTADVASVIEKQRGNKVNVTSVDPCYVYARVICPYLKKCLGMSSLEEVLHCKVLSYTIISDIPSLKVKIAKKDLYKALSANKNLLRTRLWEGAGPDSYALGKPFPTEHPAPTTCFTDLRVTTWNCRGLGTGEAYLNQLAAERSDVIVVTEHWLWPYESHRLKQVHPNFDAECRCDSRLSDTSSATKGCGGVGILYRTNHKVTTVLNITSDRICGIRISSSPPYLQYLGCICLVQMLA